jgi:lysophospholipid hydrolase
LIAGDTLQLDQDKNFYCVVDGLVQVYAHTGILSSSHPDGVSARTTQSHGPKHQHRPEHSSDSDAWNSEDMNGYHLLNEVGSGGTLSSLFTILSLFTENVHLAWPDPEDEHVDGLLDVPAIPVTNDISAPGLAVPNVDSSGINSSTRKSPAPGDMLARARADSDVSQLDLLQDHPKTTIQKNLPQASGFSTPYDRERLDGPRKTSMPLSVSMSSSASGASTSNSTVQDWENVPSPSARFPVPSTNSSRFGSGFVPTTAPAGLGDDSQQGSSGQGVPGRPIVSVRQATNPAGLAGAGGNIARASVDTTLAVIPAGALFPNQQTEPSLYLVSFCMMYVEAFKRLTSKFPKSSAHIIQ